MGSSTKIEWTDASWNPLRARNLKTGKVGWYCEHATTGCELCYAEGFNKRLGTGLPFKPGHRKDVEIFLDHEMLSAPLRWKRPRMIFVCSMTDLFADFHSDDMIADVFRIMGACDDQGKGHTFQVLTKRSKRMLDWMEKRGRDAWNGPRMNRSAWPPRNVWLGVSAERQEEADERIPDLLQAPAAVRFLSAEPLLGPIDLTAYTEIGPLSYLKRHNIMDSDLTNRLDWVICGGESGQQARPMESQWARNLRDQCAGAGVAYFFKQWGRYVPHGQTIASGRQVITGHDAAEYVAVRKAEAGRLLDGVEWNEMPRPA